MSWAPFILLAVGFLLVFIEFFLPGGIVGVIGGCVLIASIIVFAIETGSLGWTVLYVVVVGVVLGFLVRFSLKRLRKRKGIYLDTAQEGYFASGFDQALIGKEGKALTDLKPSGHIEIEGKRYQAVSRVGYVLKGTPVIVTGGEGGHLIVKQKEAS